MKEEQEIERRFLLRHPNEGYESIYHIVQYYIQDGDIVKRLRVTTNVTEGDDNTNYIPKIDLLHKKSIDFGSFIEVHEPCSLDQAKALIPKAIRSISKIRFNYTVGDLKFEVDDYENINLTVLEVELTDINQVIPLSDDWKALILFEITGIKELSNFALAEKVDYSDVNQ
jgi:CYTH domain-containing protein